MSGVEAVRRLYAERHPRPGRQEPPTEPALATTTGVAAGARLYREHRAGLRPVFAPGDPDADNIAFGGDAA